MHLGDHLGHLTYSTLVHPSDTWDEMWDSLTTYLPAVKKNVSPRERFGVSLRLSAASAFRLANDPEERARLREFLTAEDLYVYTVNAFPFGPFKGRRVMEQVYEPDWATNDRTAYTMAVADVLADVAEQGVDPAIQTALLCNISEHIGDCHRVRGSVVGCPVWLVHLLHDPAALERAEGEGVHGVDVEILRGQELTQPRSLLRVVRQAEGRGGREPQRDTEALARRHVLLHRRQVGREAVPHLIPCITRVNEGAVGEVAEVVAEVHRHSKVEIRWELSFRKGVDASSGGDGQPQLHECFRRCTHVDVGTSCGAELLALQAAEVDRLHDHRKLQAGQGQADVEVRQVPAGAVRIRRHQGRAVPEARPVGDSGRDWHASAPTLARPSPVDECDRKVGHWVTEGRHLPVEHRPDATPVGGQDEVVDPVVPVYDRPRQTGRQSRHLALQPRPQGRDSRELPGPGALPLLHPPPHLTGQVALRPAKCFESGHPGVHGMQVGQGLDERRTDVVRVIDGQGRRIACCRDHLAWHVLHDDERCAD